MFTQPISSSPPGPPSTTAVTPSRSSRLRGLSYLRNYTQTHILSRDSHHSSPNGSTSPNQQGSSLTRSVSYTPTTSAPSRSGENSNRLTLVHSTPEKGQSRSASRNAGAATSHLTIPEVDDQAGHNSAPDLTAISDTQTQTINNTAADGTANMTQRSGSPESTPSIRFSAYYDPRSTRPSLSFSPISRTLPNGNEVIRVGRYSERDSQSAALLAGNQPSASPVGFKSKVVSRRHCEFWYEDGKWYIKDVKSSSGTFLNHIRLSPPSQESKAFVVNDGDIVQLGIDFKGGEEMIFRCVKMRLELNRGWQNKLNTFNMAAHKRLRTMAATNAATSGSSSSSQDCSICLNSIAPCQSLFVAPCSHTWHFKCVRSLLTSPQYPIFICPNCRAGADLEADVDEPSEEWEKLDEREEDATIPTTKDEQTATARKTASEPADTTAQDSDAMDVTVSITTPESPGNRSSLPHAASEPLPISNPASGFGRIGHLQENCTPSPPGNGAEGPITPRNDAGPWVFDGSAGGRRPVDGSTAMRSLDAAADMDMSENVQSDDSIH